MKGALKVRNIVGNYSALSELHVRLVVTQGRRASRLPLAIIFRAFGAAGYYILRFLALSEFYWRCFRL